MKRALAGTILALASCSAATAAVIKEYPLYAGGLPNFITVGPDGNMWLTEAGGNAVSSYSEDGHAYTAYATKTSGCVPTGIAGAPTALLYACTAIDTIGDVDPQGIGADFSVPTRPSGPLLVDGLGKLWYSSGDAIVRYDGSFTQIHTGVSGASLFGMAYHSGQIYAADQAHNRVEIFDAVALTYVSHYDTTGPPYLVTVCNARVWFTVPSQNFIEDALGSGYALEIGGHVEGIACAPDGTLWYTDPGTNSIGHFHPSTSTFETYPVPTPNATPYGIAVGPDGSIWFTENTANNVGRLWLHPPGDVNGDGQLTVQDVFYLINFLFAGGPTPVP